jgi:hypothetical protein
MPSTASYDDGLVFVITIDPTATWHHSTFPEPLITVDHDEAGGIIKIVALGKTARQLAEATTSTLTALIADADEASAIGDALAAV